MKITIGHLYPDLLNLYGDRGNIRCLQKRLSWRGIEAELIPFLYSDAIHFTGLDIVLLGGGSDREQQIAGEKLLQYRREFQAFVEDMGVVLAVCGGYQLLGSYYQTKTQKIEGLNLLDIYTEWHPERLVQNVVLDSPFFLRPVVGFANHAGRTDIGKYTPLGKVVYGYGNTKESGQEGLVYRNIIATYLHGPLLPKNPDVCDRLIRQAIQRKYGTSVTLEPLSDETEHRANAAMAERLCPASRQKCRTDRSGHLD